MINKGWTEGVGVQAILDLKSHREHNRVRIGTRSTITKNVCA